MSKTNGTAAADAILRNADRQNMFAHDLTLDLINRISAYRERQPIADRFVSVAASGALSATIVAASKSEEEAMSQIEGLVGMIVGQIREGWANRLASEAQQGGKA